MDRKPVIGITMDVDEEYFKIKNHYTDAILSAGAIPLLLPPKESIITEIKNLVDGLIISGGGDIPPEYYGEKPVADNLKIVDRKRIEFEIKIIKEFLNSKKPVLGICYGMQLINVVYGGTLFQDIQGHYDGFHEIEITDNRLIPPGRYTVNSSHHQAIKKKGRGIIEIGVSLKDGIIEAIRHRDYHNLFGIQWHPERLKGQLSERIFKNFIGLLRR
ncbi:MAG: type 1 glutamine amidotransferase [Thermodesulfovibrionales bacterium]|nr:type 1 glutamine amidotransferase [Thermodesulfovibrionales bacterium]